jgi:hypothetical protein
VGFSTKKYSMLWTQTPFQCASYEMATQRQYRLSTYKRHKAEDSYIHFRSNHSNYVRLIALYITVKPVKTGTTVSQPTVTVGHTLKEHENSSDIVHGHNSITCPSPNASSILATVSRFVICLLCKFTLKVV